VYPSVEPVPAEGTDSNLRNSPLTNALRAWSWAALPSPRPCCRLACQCARTGSKGEGGGKIGPGSPRHAKGGQILQASPKAQNASLAAWPPLACLRASSWPSDLRARRQRSGRPRFSGAAAQSHPRHTLTWILGKNLLREARPPAPLLPTYQPRPNKRGVDCGVDVHADS
jgi:hypothetical protein